MPVYLPYFCYKILFEKNKIASPNPAKRQAADFMLVPLGVEYIKFWYCVINGTDYWNDNALTILFVGHVMKILKIT